MQEWVHGTLNWDGPLWLREVDAPIVLVSLLQHPTALLPGSGLDRAGECRTSGTPETSPHGRLSARLRGGGDGMRTAVQPSIFAARVSMSDSIRRIVAGVADLEEDPHLRPILGLAERIGAVLHLVHAIHVADPAFPPPVSSSATERFERMEREVHARLQAAIPGDADPERVVCHVVAGSPSGAILDTAQREHADLVVVGAAHRARLTDLILGTTAQRVIRASPLPVLVNRRPGHGPPRRILLTTDLSTLSAEVQRHGLRLIRALWGEGESAVRSLLVVNEAVVLTPSVHRESIQEQAEERHGAFLSGIPDGEWKVGGTVRMGEPAREIVAEAKEWPADLLVMGTRGHRGAARFLIGSVAEAVLRRAPCDLLLVPSAALESAEVDHTRTVVQSSRREIAP